MDELEARVRRGEVLHPKHPQWERTALKQLVGVVGLRQLSPGESLQIQLDLIRHLEAWRGQIEFREHTSSRP